MTDEKNKRKLYDALSQDYDLGSFEQFSTDVEDEVKRRKLYDAIKEEYDFPDFDGFSRQLVGEPKPKPAAQQQVQPYNGDFTMRESELEKGNSQQATVSSQQTAKPAKTQPSKPKAAAPITTPNIPSLQQMMDKDIERKKYRPLFLTDVSMDENGNRVRKPKVENVHVPGTPSPQVSPVYRDFMGNEYDATDPNVQKEAESQVHTQQINLLKTTREQVENLSGEINDAINKRGLELDKAALDPKNSWQDMPRGSGPLVHTFNSSTANGRFADMQWNALNAARNAMTDAKRIIQEADHNAKDGTFNEWVESSFAGGAARGFGQKLFDVRTWDMGLSEGTGAAALYDALQAFDSGKTLTEAQRLLLDAKAVELATNAYFGSYVGRGYKAGNVTAESVPFMIEMCLNPASGTGHAAQNAMARYAIKRFGKKVVKDNAKKYVATKVATRVAGDIAGSSVMATTTGSVGVTAGAINRMNGDVQYETNDEGLSVFAGHTEGDDFGEAFGKAFASRTIENYSEMMGEYFAPVLGWAGKGVRKGLGKVGLEGVNDFIENVAASDVARVVGDFEKNAKWNGVFGEYAEEVAGGIMNALVVGDQTLDADPETGVFNLDNNIDTFLGVSLFGGAISSVKTLGYRTPKYTARHNMTEADNAAAQIFGNQDTWGDIRNTIAVGDDADVKAKLKEVLSNPDVSAEQKLATLQYAKTVQEYKGVLAGETKRRAEQAPVQTDLETSYDNGYMLEGQEMNDAKNMLDFQRQRIGEIAADDMLQQLDEDPVSALDFIRTNEDWSDEEKQTAIDYVNAKATYEGMLQRVADDVDGRIAESDRLISERTSKTDGMIHPAVLKAENKQVYIVDGNVMMMPDGSMVDSDNSDESIIVRDAETGEISFVSPADILMVEEALDAEEERQTAQEAIRQQFAQQAADEIEGVLPFNDGDQYTVLDDEGQQHTIEVVPEVEAGGPGSVPEGSVLVSVDGAYVPQLMQKEEVQQMADAYNAARLEEYEKEKEAKRAEEVALATQQTEQGGAGGEASPEQTGANEPSAATVEPMPMIGEGEDAEPDFMAVTPERAHSYLYNEAGLSRDEANQFVDANKKAADKELEKAKKGKPQMGTSLAKYKKEQSEYQQKVDAAQQVADYWQAVKDAQQRVLSAELDARAAEDAANIAQAQQEELLRQEEELRKQAAQAALGTNNVAPAIREKWDAAPKVEGARNEIVLANGERVPGKYVLVESGAATPSHNPTAEFAKNEGFPVDENGQSVNDRDYEGDKDAQTITRQIASNYDQRALQSPVVVTNDGVVLSGNGRTMAGELAARDNTDGAYIGYLLEHPELFGFTKEQVESMAHPRVLFVPDEAMPYTADTFAKFNQQEMKGQSKTEQAVKLGKLVDDATFGRVIRSMNAYDTLGDFYADIATSTKAINELRDAGAISQAQYAEMFDGDAVSARGREMLEAMLIGKAFESNPNALRQLTEIKSLRQSVLSALAEISNNIQLGEDYSLESELSQAIDLAYQARKSGYSKAGDKVSGFARQGNLFQFDEGATVADCENVTVLLLADILNDNRSTRLKNWLAVYNKEAKDSAQGQMDLFTGDVKARQTIIDEVNILLNNGTEEEIKQQLEEAAEQRKAEAEQSLSEDGTGSESNEGDNVSGISGEGNKTFLDELKKFYDEYESGENGLITDGDFIEGARDLMYQHLDTESELYKRLMSAFEDYDDTHNAYLYENGMRDDDGSEAMIDVLRGVVAETETEPAGETAGTAAESDISPLREQYDKLKGLHPDATILFRTGDTYTFVADDANDAADILGITLETDSKGTQFAFIPSADLDKTLPMLVRSGKRVALADGIDYANPVQVAEQETDTNPTEAQKKAGNYKKGHVKIDGYDVTIENPKGSVRSGTDAGGKKWEQTMHNTYGYIRGTEGVDGDHIDVFLSDNPEEGDVYVIDQVNKDGSFDEHKVMYGFNSAEEASAAYLSNYEEGWQGLGTITGVTKDEFKKWVESSHRKTKPFAEYKSVKPTEGQNEGVALKAQQTEQRVSDSVSDSVSDTNIDNQAQEFVDAYKKWGEDVHNDALYKAYKDAQNRLHEQMRAMSDDELAAFNEKYGKQYGAIADEVRKEQGRRLNEARINKSFEDGLQAQGEITGTAKAPKVATDSFTSKDETRQVLNGVYHDESGYAVATDGKLLVADKSQYDEGNKGNIVASHKVGSYKKGDVIPGNYPKWRMVVDGMEGSNTASVTWDGLRNFLAGAEEILKSRWKADKESGNTKDSFAKWSSDAIVAIRMPNGEVCVYNYDMLRAFSDAAASMDMSEITFGAEKPLKATNDKGVVMLMPVNPTAIAEEEFGHENEGRRLYYEWGGAEKAQASKPAADAAGTVAKPAEAAATTAEGTAAGKPAATRTRASKVGKIDDFGEKIGGARKDVARGRIRDTKKMTVKDLTTLKKGADDILSQANIMRLYKDGQMDEQTARGFMALNNAAKVAMKHASPTGREIIMTKYRDAAVAWEEGKPFVFEVTDDDIKAYQSQFGVQVTDEKARESLDYLITDPYNMFMQTYEAIDYPAVERKLGQYVIVDYTSMKGRHLTPSRPYWVKNGLRAQRGYPFATMESAVAQLKKLCPEVTEKEKKARGEKAEHGLHVTKEGYGFYIKSRNIPGNIYLSPKFWTEKEAQKYLDDNLERLKEREQRLVDALMGSNIGMAEREGVDYRNGKDVTPQDFLDEFGFRGVEFGNWVPQGERQMYLNKTYDAIKDFCAIVGISPRAFSLGGRLGLAFGARGKSRAMAHYEPGKEVINLTRMSGVGSLAHEWFHALDNYLAKQKTGNMSDMATETHDVVREELGDVFKEMFKAMRALDYDKRSRRAGEYWGRTVEEFARLFENYIYNKLAAKETTSPVLVREDVLLDNIGDDLKNSWPYPSAEENAKMEPYFDKLFDTIQEKTDANGNVVLFQKVDGSTIEKENDAAEEALRDEVIRLMREAGIEVSTDWEEGQRVLDTYRELVRLMGGGKKKSTSADPVPSETSPFKAGFTAEVDAAKVAKNLESLIEKAKNYTKEQKKGFIEDLAKVLKTRRYGSKSEYATFETKNGLVTIRLADHNAKTSNFDHEGRSNGVSIVISRKPNDGIENDGKAHIVEFFYPDKALKKAEGTPYADIVRSIQQMIYSGEYNDATGLATRQEVNADALREMRAYHGSGADFDAFDHSHMGEGEGAQAYGWGTYVTEVEGIGRTYARSMARKPIGSRPVLYKGEDYQKANQDGWSDAQKEVFNEITDQMRSQGRDTSTAIDNVRGTINLDIQFNEKGVERSNISEKKWNDAIAFLNGMTDEQFKQFVNSGEWIGLEEDLRGLKYAINDNRDLGRGGILLVCEQGVEDAKRNKELYANRKAYKEKKLEALKDFDESDFTRVAYEPTLYTVDIPEDNGSNYLDYDASMEQQADLLDAIGKGLEKLGWKRNGMTWSNETHRVGYELAPYKKGRRIYEALSNMLGSDKAASEFLHDVGIVGMKYPTEFRSGGRSDGSKNYAIFDENDAKITDKIKFFRTSNGDAYGFTLNGKIYLDPRIATSETPIHEYAHLWAQALRQANPEAWEKLKEEMRNEQDVMDYVKRLYPEITDEDELMEEVFTHYSGKRGAERLRNDMRAEMAKADGILEKARVATIFAKLRDMLSKFWNMARDLFAGNNEKLASMKGEDFADMMMNDLMSGFKPESGGKNATEMQAGKINYQFVGEQGAAEADRAEGVVTRIEGLATAKQMEADGRPALNIKMATGWERGKDGKWRYETEDDINAADKGIDAVLKEARKEVEELEKKADNLLARINRLDSSIPKRLTDRYSEEEKAKYTKMREERDQLIKEWSKANRAFRAQEDENRIDGIKTTLGEILGDDYELFKYYPDMKDMSVTLTERLDANGEYDKGSIKLRLRLDGMGSTLLHEIQHAIQQKEGFARGGNVSSVIDDDEVNEVFVTEVRNSLNDVEDKLNLIKDAKGSDEAVARYAEERGISEEDARAYLDSEEARLMLKERQYNHLFEMLGNDNLPRSTAFEYYKRIAGEVEARNVQARAGMTPEERRRSLAEETEDILRGEQIVTYGDAGGSASIVDDENEVQEVAKSERLYRKPTFYSNAERAVEGIKQEKATPDQWLAMITKAGGLKAGEDKWMGLSEWLTQRKTAGHGGSITKQEVLDFIRSNRVEVEDVDYSEGADVENNERMQELRNEFDELLAEGSEATNSIFTSDWADWALEEMVSRYGDDFRDGFTWEKNAYGHPVLVPGYDWDGGISGQARYYLGIEDNPINSTRLDYTTEGLENKREIALVVPNIESWNEGDEVHFGDAGEGRAIAWIRFGETYIYNDSEEYTEARRGLKELEEKYNGHLYRNPDMTPEDEALRDKLVRQSMDNTPNRSKVLVIDEIQSKRHQEGREKGYQDKDARQEYKAIKRQQQEIIDKVVARQGYFSYDGEGMTEDEASLFDKLSEKGLALELQIRRDTGVVPDAPFDKNWHELAMKRMLRYAAENGYDKIAWTKGEQQAERYDIGNVVDKIISYDYPSTADKEGRSTKKIEVRLKDGGTMTMRINDEGMVIEGRSDTYGKSLSEIVGKDLAARIMSDEGREGSIYDADRDLPAKIIDGDGLRIGAEGMAGFYDQIMPRFMDKYGKKWGVKTGEVDLPEIGQKMHAVDVTPEMKESVMEGQPMFREGSWQMSYEDSLAASNAAGYTKRQHDTWWNRRQRDKRNMAEDMAAKMHLTDRVTIVDNADELDGMGFENLTDEDRQSKGWFDPKTGKIVIILGNNASPYDVLQTMLHEGVNHYGLRELFGKNFLQFLDNVYENATPEIRAEIVSLAKNNGWDFRTATEEYLGKLAEDTDFENAEKSGWWHQIKSLFLDMLHSIGLYNYGGAEISDNELRYILWRSYENLVNPGRYRNLFDVAKDIAKQYELGVGNYEKSRYNIFSIGRLDMSRQAAEDMVAERGGKVLFRDGDSDGTKEAYNEAVSTGKKGKLRMTSFNFREAFQDSMLALKKLQEIVEKKFGVKLASFEDAYKYENTLSSLNMRQQEKFYKDYYTPMMKIADKIVAKEGASVKELNEYLICKHGLERNRVFAERDFEKYKKEHPDGEKTLDDFRKRDYSGLTEITSKEGIEEIEAEAERIVQEFEAKHGESCAKLWEAINTATKETLAHGFKCGMMSKATYEKVRDMFKYYVPLRGWDADTAEDVYDYVRGDYGGAFNATLKAAKGRTTTSDDVLATIGNMGYSSILQGNRNKMKICLFNMASRYPTDVCSVRDMWLVENALGEWVSNFPAIPEDATPEQVADILETHEVEMSALEEQGKAKRQRNALDIGFHIDKKNIPEHAVVAYIGGKPNIVYINGNPRAAQAVNVKTGNALPGNNPLARLVDFIFKDTKRYYSSMLTTYKPTFAVSNFVRDLGHSIAMTYVDKGLIDMAKYIANLPVSMAYVIKGQSGFKAGDSKMSTYFREFLDNGGMTGYAHLEDVEQWKAKNKRRWARLNALQKAGYAPVKAIGGLMAAISWLSETLELIPRFNTYVAERRDGKDILTSVKAAKDITVNFNKKGSEVTPGVWGAVANTLRYEKMFFNPIVQSLEQFYRLGKKHPVRMAVATLHLPILGAIMPYVNMMLVEAFAGGDGDDDKDKYDYWLQNEYTRRNNILIFTGNGYIKIPIAQGFREFYGMGEAIATRHFGKCDDFELAYSLVEQIRTMFSIEGQTNYKQWSLLRFIMPEQYGTLADIANNENFMGGTLWYENMYKEHLPEYKKAKPSTWSPLVSISKQMNEWLGYDDDVAGDMSGRWMNPAAWQHVIQNYGGGVAEMVGDIASMVIDKGDDKETDSSQWPIAKRFYTKATEERANWVHYGMYKDFEDDYEFAKEKVSALNKKDITDEEWDRQFADFAKRHPKAAAIYSAWDDGELVKDIKKAEFGSEEFWELINEAVDAAEKAVYKPWNQQERQQ